MNQVLIFAKFDKKPSEKEIEQIKNDIFSFLKGLSNDIEIQIRTGDGSWWIEVTGLAFAASGWLINQFAGYAALKDFLNYFKKKLKQRNQLQNSQEEKSITPQNQTKEFEQKNQIYDKTQSLYLLHSNLNYKKEYRPLKLMVTEWSDKENKGVCLSIEEKEGGVVVKHHTTSSKEDVDTFRN